MTKNERGEAGQAETPAELRQAKASTARIGGDLRRETRKNSPGEQDATNRPGDADSVAKFLSTRPWMQRRGRQLVGRGHVAGDLLRAYDWTIEHETKGHLEVLARLHEGLLNPQGQLFGGFTGTIVDFLSLLTVRAPLSEPTSLGWLATVNLRIDYLAPVWGPEFRIRGDVTHQRGKKFLTTIRFFDLDGQQLVHALTTMIERPR